MLARIGLGCLPLIFHSVRRTKIMAAVETLERTSEQKTEHFDVLIVGAGISGVGAAYIFPCEK